MCTGLLEETEKKSKGPERVFITFWSGRLPTYRLMGYVGFLAAMALGARLTNPMGLSRGAYLLCVASSVLVFYLLSKGTYVFTGRETLVYYHYQALILCSSFFVAMALDKPPLPYLDMTILSIGTFLFFGRIGCFMVGCCHGRPHRWGICYGKSHERAGFSSHLVGVRLFPLQLVESFALSIIIVYAVAIIFDRQYVPGDVLGWYVVSYGLFRFTLEFFRGDAGRFHLLGFSEAQWTSLFFMTAIVWMEMSGFLPAHAWHTGAALFTAIAMATVYFFRMLDQEGLWRIARPEHVKELAHAARILDRNGYPGGVGARTTSCGIIFSAGRMGEELQTLNHYAFSRQGRKLKRKTAFLLSSLILALKHPGCRGEIVEGDGGVFHLLLKGPPGENNTGAARGAKKWKR